MAVTIDSLEIQITNDSSKATRAIGNLIKKLKELKSVAGMGADLIEVAKAIRVIKQATEKSNIASGTTSAMKQIKKATQDATVACDAHVRAWEHYLDVQDRIKDMKIDDMTGATDNIKNYSDEWDKYGNSPNTKSVSYGNEVRENAENYKISRQNQAKEYL